MRVLLLGATEGLRYRLTDMLSMAMPEAQVQAQAFSSGKQLPDCDVVLAAIGRNGENLAPLRNLTTSQVLSRTTVLALTDELDSAYSGREIGRAHV